MTVSLVSSGAFAYSAAAGTTVSPTYPATISAGNMLILIVGLKSSTANAGTVTTPSGWTLVLAYENANSENTGGYTTTLGAGTGNTNLYVYKKVAAGTETGTLAVTLGTNNVSLAAIYNYSKTAANWRINCSPGNDVTTGTAVGIGAFYPLGVASGDQILMGMVYPDNVATFSAESFASSGATIGTVTEIAEAATATGNRIGGVVASAACTAGSSAASIRPTFTATAAGTTTNVRGPGFMIRIAEFANLTPTTLQGPDAFTGTNGAALPANWAVGSDSATGATTVINANRARMTTGSAGGYTGQTSRKYTTQYEDAVYSGKFQFPSTVELYTQFYIRDSGGVVDGNGGTYLEIADLAQQVAIAQQGNFGNTRGIGSATSITINAATDYNIIYGIVGNVLQWKIWPVGGTDPGYTVLDHSLGGGVGTVGIRNGPGATGSRVFDFDDMSLLNYFPVSTTSVTSDSDLRWAVRSTVNSDSDERWAVRALIVSDSDERWIVRNRVNSDSDQRWAVRALLNSDSDQRYAVRSVLTSDSDERWAVRAPVTSDSDLRWISRVAVASDSDERWITRNRVNSDSDLRWAVRSVVTSDSDERWAVRSVVTSNSDERWAVRSVVTSDSDIRWAVRAVVTSDSDERWITRNAVASDSDIRWISRVAINSDIDLRYGVTSSIATITSDHSFLWVSRVTVNSDSDQRWIVRAVLTSDSDERWAVRSQVQTNTDLRWISRTMVQSDSDQRWAVRSRLNSDSDQRWAVRSVVLSDLDHRWITRAQVQADVDLRWITNSSVSSLSVDHDFRWAVRAVVLSQFDLRWAVRSVLTGDLDTRYAVRSVALSASDLRWAVRSSLQSDLNAVWRVRGVTSADLDVRWTGRGLVIGDLSLKWISNTLTPPASGGVVLSGSPVGPWAFAGSGQAQAATVGTPVPVVHSFDGTELGPVVVGG
jgi:hypothetical protein